jgi:hypothetical protein
MVSNIQMNNFSVLPHDVDKSTSMFASWSRHVEFVGFVLENTALPKSLISIFEDINTTTDFISKPTFMTRIPDFIALMILSR